MKFLVCVCVFSEVLTPLFYVRNLIKQKRNFLIRFLLLNFFLCLCDEGLKEEEFLDKHYCDKVFFRAHVASAQETRAHAHLSLSLSVLDIYIYIYIHTHTRNSV